MRDMGPGSRSLGVWQIELQNVVGRRLTRMWLSETTRLILCYALKNWDGMHIKRRFLIDSGFS
jgi:hypothetical protein